MASHDDHAAALIARFPRLFKGTEPDLWITTGSGWNLLLIELFEKLDQLLDDAQAALFRVRQVKEKFGGLRVYYTVGDSAEIVLDLISPTGVATMRVPPKSEGSFPREAVDRCIAHAVARARVTCERCGNPGKLRPGGWITVLCDACNAARAAERGDDE